MNAAAKLSSVGGPNEVVVSDPGVFGVRTFRQSKAAGTHLVLRLSQGKPRPGLDCRGESDRPKCGRNTPRPRTWGWILQAHIDGIPTGANSTERNSARR